MASSSEVSVPKAPVHPATSFAFPQREFGKTTIVKCSCQAAYFKTWTWLTYDDQRDVVLCHTRASGVRAKRHHCGLQDFILCFLNVMLTGVLHGKIGRALDGGRGGGLGRLP